MTLLLAMVLVYLLHILSPWFLVQLEYSWNDVCEWLSMMESTMMKKKACNEVKTSLNHWRDQWLGHPLIKVISHVLSQTNLPIPMSKSKFSFCNSCNSNKSHKPLFSVSTLESYSLLDLISFDIRGHPICSMDDLSYFVIFVDYFIKYSWLFPIAHKYYIYFFKI